MMNVFASGVVDTCVQVSVILRRHLSLSEDGVLRPFKRLLPEVYRFKSLPFLKRVNLRK